MKISILGLGWFGLALGQELKGKYQVCGTTRTEEKLSSLRNFFSHVHVLNLETLPPESILDSDVIIINIPPFKGQLEWFKNWKIKKDKHIIFISSTSVYGEKQFIVDEDTNPIPDTENGKILIEEEEWIKSFDFFTIIRFGGLIGQNRHPGKFLSGRTGLGGGNYPVNLIHQEDAVQFTKMILEKKMTGEVYNLVHPNHPSRRDYYENYCRVHHLDLPHFLEQSDEGKKVSSLKASRIYSFRQPI